MSRLLLTLGVCLGLATPSLAADAPDPSVAKLLKKLDLGYTIDADNDYSVILQVGNGRSQQLLISSEVERYEGLEIRRVMSAAYAAPTESFERQVAIDLLTHSQGQTLGSWELYTDGPTSVALFVAKVPAKITHKQLQYVMELVVTTAERTEIALTDGGDAF